MSDDQLAAAAAALNAPEAIVKRSAEARAKADGIPVEQVLAAWAGGESNGAPGDGSTERPEDGREAAETPKRRQTAEAERQPNRQRRTAAGRADRSAAPRHTAVPAVPAVAAAAARRGA